MNIRLGCHRLSSAEVASKVTLAGLLEAHRRVLSQTREHLCHACHDGVTPLLHCRAWLIWMKLLVVCTHLDARCRRTRGKILKTFNLCSIPYRVRRPAVHRTDNYHGFLTICLHHIQISSSQSNPSWLSTLFRIRLPWSMNFERLLP